MELTGIVELVALAGLAMLSVGLWTLRVAVTSRGSALLGATLAALEATVFIVAVSRLLTDIDSPARVAAYGIGVAVGTLVGMRLDAAVNPRLVRIDIVSPGSGLIDALSRERIPHTLSHGLGASGPVMIISVVVLQRELARVTKLVRSTDPRAFWTVTSLTGMRLDGHERRRLEATQRFDRLQQGIEGPSVTIRQEQGLLGAPQSLGARFASRLVASPLGGLRPLGATSRVTLHSGRYRRRSMTTPKKL